jgi:hypothetical protein
MECGVPIHPIRASASQPEQSDPFGVSVTDTMGAVRSFQMAGSYHTAGSRRHSKRSRPASRPYPEPCRRLNRIRHRPVVLTDRVSATPGQGPKRVRRPARLLKGWVHRKTVHRLWFQIE